MKIFLFLLSILFLIISFGQTAEEYNKQGKEKPDNEKGKVSVDEVLTKLEQDVKDQQKLVDDKKECTSVIGDEKDAEQCRIELKKLKDRLKSLEQKVAIHKKKKESKKNPVIVSDFCYNEIPPGVQLVQTESEWSMLSKTKACCCYPSFNSQNKSLGLLYNYKAYALIKQKLVNDQEGITVCSKEDWGNILKQIEQNHQMIQTLQFNDYPGYYDEDWYTPELGFSAYWHDENSMYTFSKQTYGEPMLDDHLFDERQRTCALSIRIVKSSKIYCKKKKYCHNLWIIFRSYRR